METGNSMPNLRETAHLLHYVSDQQTNFRIAHHLNQRGTRQRANRIEGSVAQNLDPNLVADTSGERAAQARGEQRLRNSAAAIGALSIRFAERNSAALDVLNHSRRRNLGRKVDDGPNHPMRFDSR